MRNWFFRLYKHNIHHTNGMPLPKKVFDYLKEKSFVEGIPGASRVSKEGYLAARQIFSYDELREKHAKAKPIPEAAVSPTQEHF